MAASPTQLTLKLLRKEGYLAEVVERWNPFAKIRQDLFGIVDVIGVKENETIAVQTTSKTNTSSRKKKILESANARILQHAWRFEVHGWYKDKNRWQCKRIPIEFTGQAEA